MVEACSTGARTVRCEVGIGVTACRGRGSPSTAPCRASRWPQPLRRWDNNTRKKTLHDSRFRGSLQPDRGAEVPGITLAARRFDISPDRIELDPLLPGAAKPPLWGCLAGSAPQHWV